MDPFEKVKVGTNGVEVSRLGLGTAPLSGSMRSGGIFGGVSRSDAIAVMDRAFDIGISHVDTAPFYGRGHAEARIGDSRFATGDRSGFVISTKIGRVLEPVPGGVLPNDDPDGVGDLEAVNTWSRDDVHRSIEESLRRLNLDRIDIVYVHDPDEEEFGEEQANEEAFPALIELREQGTIGAIGCGMNQWEMPLRFIQRFDLDIVLLAGRYTLLEQTSLDTFLPACVERNVKVSVGGPYNTGILARDLSEPVTYNYEVAPDDLVQKARRLNAICASHGVDLKAAALQFALAHPAIANVIPGAQSVGELDQNVEMVRQPIPASVWDEMRQAGLIPEHAPT